MAFLIFFFPLAIKKAAKCVTGCVGKRSRSDSKLAPELVRIHGGRGNGSPFLPPFFSFPLTSLPMVRHPFPRADSRGVRVRGSKARKKGQD